jgi:hypothetical protein
MAEKLPDFLGNDQVLVYNQDSFQQVFKAANIMKGSFKEPSKLMEHPNEKGIILADHRITLQNEIELPLVISANDYNAVYTQIKNLRNSGTLLSVQSRITIYDNMVVIDMPHEENPDMFDAVALTLRLKQVFFDETIDSFAPTEKAKAKTIKSGQKNGKKITTTPNLKPVSSRAMPRSAITVDSPVHYVKNSGKTISYGAVTVN